MKILVDTSVWSLALRRKKSFLNEEEKSDLKELVELINESRCLIIGPVRQEILSGIQNETQFNLLKGKLKAFEDLKIEKNDYELAAYLYNKCRKNGIQGSHIDFLICAVASNNKISIFTRDHDFVLYSQYCDIELHKPRKIKGDKLKGTILFNEQCNDKDGTYENK